MPVAKSYPLFEVIKSGPLTTVQDQGRSNNLDEGVPISGAMDLRSLIQGNEILGNSRSAAGLEITFHQFEVVFINLMPTSMVIVGNSVIARLNSAELKNNRSFTVENGDRLKLRSASPMVSARTYLCCAGGIAIPEILGSGSTYVSGGFGGYQGRALRVGDRIEACSLQSRPIRNIKNNKLDEMNFIRFIPHHSPNGVSESWIQKYLETSWRVDPQSNRMGLRLMPSNLDQQKKIFDEIKTPDRVLSQGVFFGVIQLTHGGNPIILGADSQTIGGYPLIGCVISEDLWKCGQVLPGSEIRLTLKEE